MAGLNEPQREAAEYISGPMLVLAGAGSGKTRVITQKIAYLIRECGIKPIHIAAVTFTNKAAREMKARVKGLLGKGEGRGLIVSTFHNLGLRILGIEHKHLGYKTGFSVFDSADTLVLIKGLYASESLSNVDDAEEARWAISRWKNDFISPEQAIANAENDIEIKHAMLYVRYQRQLKAYNAFDFDDLILQPVVLFQKCPDVLQKWQNRIHYLLVDEYQDTNASQYQLVKMLLGDQGRLTAVGDDDQSVYSWRGARPENLALLNEDYPKLNLIKLEQNYRSTSRILKCANHLIQNNPHTFEKQLWSDLGLGSNIRIIECPGADGEAERVTVELNTHKFQKRTSFGDYAILYRGNHQARIFEKYLREMQIPYVVSGGTSFFERPEVKDMMGYLRLLANQDDDTAFLRIINTPRREIGGSTLEKLGEYANARNVSLFEACFEMGLSTILNERAVTKLQNFTNWINLLSDNAERGDPIEVVKDMIKDIGYQDWLEELSSDIKIAEKRMENVYELVEWLARLHKDDSSKNLGALVAHMSLMDILERNKEEAKDDMVSLMTLHAAKGLEFPYVFMVGVEEECLPHRTSIMEENLDEERRLCYVGITRAQKELTITYAKHRRRYGEDVECEPSRFLTELPEDEIEWEGSGRKVDEVAAKERGRGHLAALKDMLA
ncbi:MAG: DNA helicase Rep [endosymbiont of Galathealinum brachiosum]|uniref:ATP-dependent DNA helicase Rep n=1 Tax=endosymbiont of Galathealinum brachiosum TaxID=2200906 RepID=A0A370DC08_9GAMM|nr:MAG: DNA helicase Rep [endosymbiont of Galathealinum brachiosum]